MTAPAPRRRVVLHRLPDRPARRSPPHPSRPTATRSGSCSPTSSSSPASGRPASTSPTSTPRRSDGFLAMLERERNNTGRTRSQRLAAIHSLFRPRGPAPTPSTPRSSPGFLAIQPRKASRKTIDYLTEDEADALLASPDPHHPWTGRPDPPPDAPHDHQRPPGLRDHRTHLGRHRPGKTRRARALARQGTQGANLPAPGARRRRAAALAAREPTPPPARSCSPPAATARKMSTDAVAERIKIHAATAAAACPRHRRQERRPACPAPYLRDAPERAAELQSDAITPRKA